MTVRELKAVLAVLSEETIVEVYVDSEFPRDSAIAREVIIGTEPNRVCIYGEE